MPNQRKNGKKSKNIWLTREESEVLARIEQLLGVNGSDAIKLAIREYAKQKGLTDEQAHD